ncbi:hypothetical protein V8C34DRAFT_303149 [Trichoderma compactum]
MSHFFFSEPPIYPDSNVPDNFFKEWAKDVEDYEEYYEQIEIFKKAKPTRYNTLELELERKWRDIWDNASTKKFDELKEDFARSPMKLANGAELTVIRIVHD